MSSAAPQQDSIPQQPAVTPNTTASAPTVPEPPRFLSESRYRALLDDIHRLTPKTGVTTSWLNSAWRSDVRWARNRTTVAGDWRNVGVGVRRGAQMAMNQLDHDALRAGIEWVEDMRTRFEGPASGQEAPMSHAPRRFFPATHIWSDATYAQTQDVRLQIANRMISGAEAAGMLSAGYLCVDALSSAIKPQQTLLYATQTRVQCSLTVRDPEGTSSGWAGASSYDWGRIDPDKLAAVALDKCLKGRNPVRIEPGRYTVIMEPQAIFGLVDKLWRNEVDEAYWDLFRNMSKAYMPFHDEQTSRVAVSQFGPDVILQRTKIGQRVFDPRINISFEPLDPDLGCVPFDIGGYPIQPVQWITNGVLTTLNYAPALGAWELMQLGYPVDPKGKPDPGSYRIDGGPKTNTIEEMIESTERGLLVTRFWGIQLIDIPSVLCSGTTRDGLWLIEHGKITHAVKNLRFTESPIFALNQVEQIGVSVPIFSPGAPAMTPPIKVRDFSFTALEDAV